MTVKKSYNIGDVVWIYGIGNNRKSTQGTVVHSFTLEHAGWSKDIVHYVVSIPTEIEPLLEVRTWDTISQTKDGHVGSIRDAFENPDAGLKLLSRTGMTLISQDDQDFTGDGHDGMGSTLDDYADSEIDPDVIHAALERAKKNSTHPPLVFGKESTSNNGKPRRRYPPKKKKT